MKTLILAIVISIAVYADCTVSNVNEYLVSSLPLGTNTVKRKGDTYYVGLECDSYHSNRTSCFKENNGIIKDIKIAVIHNDKVTIAVADINKTSNTATIYGYAHYDCNTNSLETSSTKRMIIRYKKHSPYHIISESKEIMTANAVPTGGGE